MTPRLEFDFGGQAALDRFRLPDPIHVFEYPDGTEFRHLAFATVITTNTVGAALNRFWPFDIDGDATKPFELDEVMGTPFERFLPYFTDVTNQYEAAKVKGRIAREEASRQLLKKTGFGIAGPMALASGTVLDPVFILGSAYGKTVANRGYLFTTMAERQLMREGKLTHQPLGFMHMAAADYVTAFAQANTTATMQTTMTSEEYWSQIALIEAGGMALLALGAIGDGIRLTSSKVINRTRADATDALGRHHAADRAEVGGGGGPRRGVDGRFASGLARRSSPYSAQEARPRDRRGAFHGPSYDMDEPRGMFSPDSRRWRRDGRSRGRAPTQPGASPQPSPTGVDPTGWVGDLVGRYSPIMRTLNSGSRLVAETAEQLAEAGFWLRKNRGGVATAQSVETLAKTHRIRVVEALNAMDETFLSYRRQQAGRGPKRADSLRFAAGDLADRATGRTRTTLTHQEFYEAVTDTMWSGRPHAIGEVNQAATAMRRFYDGYADELMQAGLVAEKRADYAPTLYDVAQLAARQDEFVTRVQMWQRAYLPAEKQLSEPAIRQAIRNILRDEPPRAGPDNIVRNPFHEIDIGIPRTEIADFLVRDASELARRYGRSVAADLELQRKFGDVDMTGPMDRIKRDYDGRIAAAATPEEAAALRAARDSDVEDLVAMRDLIRGTYRVDQDPLSLSSRAARIGIEWSHLALMGGATLAAIPDLGRIVMVNGMKDTFQVLKLMRADIDAFRRAGAEGKLAGTALEMALNSRVASLVYGGDMPRYYTPFERTLGQVTNGFFVANLLSPWNAMIKQFTGIVSGHKLIEAVQKIADGTIDAQARTWAAAAGIDARNARSIARQLQQHGETVHGVHLPNTHLWDDVDAQRLYRAALAREVDSIIVTPSAGELPLAAHTPLGRLLFLYKKFAMSAAQRIMVGGLQQRDGRALMGASMMVFLGGMVASLRDEMRSSGSNIRHADDSLWLTDFLVEGVDRSGVTGWLADVNNAVETLSGRTLGVRPALGVGESFPPSFDYQLGAVSPVFGLAARATDTLADMISGASSAEVAQGAMRLVPGQNLPYWGLANMAHTSSLFTAVRDAP